MKPEDITEEWLKQANERYRSRDLPPIRRPFEAIMDLSNERKCGIDLSSPAARKICDWFEAHTKPDAHSIEPMFTGAFYYDACFWPIHILLGYGQLRLNAIDSLRSMPPALKQDMQNDRDSHRTYVLYWADCLDYGMGVEEVLNTGKLSAAAAVFLKNGDRELRGAISQLIAPRPNSKAILSLRMACEIFLKVFLVQEKGYGDRDLKRLSHCITDISKEAYQVKPYREFQIVEKFSNIFPEVSERYDGEDWPLSEVWKAIYVTQVAASTVVRHYSERDIRPQIQK